MNTRIFGNRAKAGLRTGAGGLLIALLAATQPYAQKTDQTIARLRSVTGNVLVSKESGLASGDEELRLTPGTRVITTANSTVVIEYDDGCRVTLKENQRFEVEKGKACAQLVAQPQSILLTPEGAIATAFSVAAVVIPATLGIGAVTFLIESRSKTTASPS
jgi:hypothetical protein